MPENNNHEIILFRLENSEKEIKKLEKKIDLLLDNTFKLGGVIEEMRKTQVTVDREIQKIRDLEILASELKTDRNWLKKIQFLVLGALISGLGGLILGVISLFLKK